MPTGYITAAEWYVWGPSDSTWIRERWQPLEGVAPGDTIRIWHEFFEAGPHLFRLRLWHGNLAGCVGEAATITPHLSWGAGKPWRVGP